MLAGGFSEALVQALTLAAREGKRPRVLCAEGQPLLEGRRLARRLVGEELEIELVHDAALLDCVSEADRIWIASEALGARGSLVRVGTSRVAREALDEGVPLRVLATSDALLPGGELLTPRWIELDRTLLWVGAPETVELRTRFLEPLSFELAGELLTENGRESAEELFLRALRIEPVPRCAGVVPRELPAARATPRHYAPRGANAHVSAAAIPAIAPATASAAHEQLRPAPRGAQPTSIRSGEEADSPRIT